MNLPQPPEGILDPQKPWHLPMPKSPGLWGTLKARLTGRPNEYGNYSSYVNIGDADADRLIENMKKDPRGYPQLDQTSGTPSQWMDRQRIYQEWLVENYLENPFREQVNEKIDQTFTPTDLPKLEVRKRKQQQKKEEAVEAKEEKEVQKEVDKITEELDNTSDNQPKPETKEQEKEAEQASKDSSDIKDSLDKIKSSLSSQISITDAINNTDSVNVSSLNSLVDLFKTQTDIIRREVEIKAQQEREVSLEQFSDLSGSVGSTSTMDNGKAKGKIVKVDGDLLTVKSLEGSFKEGSTITQGDSGFDLLGILKNIGSKIFGKGAGSKAGSSPMKLSSGGIISGPTSLAKGGYIPPGIYNKPTRGNLLPGQAVIPLNRNVGKDLNNRQVSGRDSKQQPFADALQAPLKAVGLSVLATTGDFLKSLGPLAGFYSPYVSSLLKPMSVVLGIPVSILDTLVGGPASAATRDLKEQTNVFADIWSSIMDKFGYVFGDSGKDDKKKGGRSRKKTTPSNGMIPGDAPAEVKAMLEAISAGEGSWDSVNPSTTVEGLSGMTISAARRAAMAKGIDQLGGSGAMGKWQQMPAFIIERAKDAGLNPDKDLFNAENQTKIARMLMASVYPGGEKQLVIDVKADPLSAAAKLRGTWPSLPGGSQENTSREKFLSNFKKSMQQYSAESGTNNSQGKLLDAFMISGPDSGYDVSDSLKMHGEELFLNYEKGFTILPVENRKFSLTRDPLKTISQWERIMKSSPKRKGGEGYATGGKVTLYAGHADMLANSSGGLGTNGGPKGDAPKIPQAKGYFTTEAYLNDQIAAKAASKSGGNAIYKSPIRTLNGSDKDSNWERAKKDISDGNYPVELHHDAETGKAGVITSSAAAATSNKFFKSIHGSYGFYRTGTEGFVSRGGMILELDALREGIRKNPSGWISSASTKLANAIRKAANIDQVEDSTEPTTSPSESEEQAPQDPFEAMESAIKNLSVSLGMLSAINTGEIKSKEDYSRIRSELQSQVDSVASPTPPPAQTKPTASPSPATVVRGTNTPIDTSPSTTMSPVSAVEIHTARSFA